MQNYIQFMEDFAAKKLASCHRDPEPLNLKLEHTFRVLQNAVQIVKEERFAAPIARATLLAALFHDLARFDQYLQYGTFKDKLSRNHGAWACQLVRRLNIFKDENPATARLARIAICLHNRRSLPHALQEPAMTICKAVRDSDKLDILRVMAKELEPGKPHSPTVVLGLPDDPNLASPAAIAAVLKRNAPSYNDLLSVNDFRLLLGAWVFDMNFSASRALFRKNGYARILAQAIPDNDAYRQAKKLVLAELA